MRARSPRELARLPYAHRLTPFTGAMEREGTYEWLHFDGCVLEDVDGGSSGFTESAFSAVTLTRGRYRRSQFDDVWLNTVRMVGTDLAETTWMDSECGDVVLAGTELSGSHMNRVAFYNCKFDSVNARMAKLRNVSFVDCLLRDVDFGGAVLTNITFPGSTLDRAHFDNAKMTKVDLREAAGLSIASGLEALKGATISTHQLLDLAPALAQVLGLTVRDA
ncbi:MULTISPECIES: pentapeptide repeat-containing protein [Streptomyces]|uniref:pentapeptide repeat-containing protein n=1 Tax=Streptomyces TaxID=1883 RepID=UPI001D09E7E3|nr:pentapeptide repeat-containing protein [Streptomyces longhuiensis]UDM03302.1 pentapeptide repeat-containing protein [Streptomyces longhuiensis]